MSEMTVVLGWDGLDYDLVEKLDLSDSFGPYRTRLETFDNPVLGKPHTNELWPSIITGEPPAVHGIHAATSSGVDWRNPFITRLSQSLGDHLPWQIRRRIGRIGRQLGFQHDNKYATYYDDHDCSTVFDGRRSRPIAIPNYRVPADDELGIAFDRATYLQEFLVVDEQDEHSPKIPLVRLDEHLARETGEKFGVLRAAIRREYDIVFVWLGFLDTIGHLAPVVVDEDPGWQEWAYRMAAAWTDEVKAALSQEDTLICVSDHGLREGEHTHDAFLGSTNDRVIEDAASVLDVHEAIDRVTPTSEPIESPPLRERFAESDADLNAQQAADNIQQRLEDLGYF